MNKLVSLVMLVFVPTAVVADPKPDLSPSQEKAKEEMEGMTEASLSTMNKNCGTSVALASDYDHYKSEDWDGESFTIRCSAVLDGIAYLCTEPAYQRALVKQLKAVTCSFSGAKPGAKKATATDVSKSNMSFEKGQFVYRMHKSHTSVGEATKVLLKERLK